MPVPIRITMNCYLCGSEVGPLRTAWTMRSPALGNEADYALSTTTWLCSKTCWNRGRGIPDIRGRIYAGHDAKLLENEANLQAALQETESAHVYLATLPDGLRVTEDEIERVRQLDGDYSAKKLDDPETLRAAFKLLRNHKRIPYYHHPADGRHEIWGYQELFERLTNLERNPINANRNLST